MDCFQETQKYLHRTFELLRCVKCSKIPGSGTVYIPFKCDHKYCDVCSSIETLKNCEICFSAKKHCEAANADIFTSKLLQFLNEFSHKLNSLRSYNLKSIVNTPVGKSLPAIPPKQLFPADKRTTNKKDIYLKYLKKKSLKITKSCRSNKMCVKKLYQISDDDFKQSPRFHVRTKANTSLSRQDEQTNEESIKNRIGKQLKIKFDFKKIAEKYKMPRKSKIQTAATTSASDNNSRQDNVVLINSSDSFLHNNNSPDFTIPENKPTTNDVLAVEVHAFNKEKYGTIRTTNLDSNFIVYFDYDVDAHTTNGCVETLKLQVSSELRTQVTHIVFSIENEEDDANLEVDLSYAYLYGVASGCWLVSQNWIRDCIENKKIIHPKYYEITNCRRMSILFPENNIFIPKMSRLSNQLPGIFAGITFIFSRSDNLNEINKIKMLELIQKQDGLIIDQIPQLDTGTEISEHDITAWDPLQYMKNVSYIVLHGCNTQRMTTATTLLERRPYLIHLHRQWVIDSIICLQLMSPINYTC